MLEFLFNTLWGWWGIGGLIIAGALAVAWFFPPFRNVALTVAAGAAAALTLYTKGSQDGSRNTQQKWSDAEKRMVSQGTEARVDAQRRADAGELPDDEFDRDKSEVRRP